MINTALSYFRVDYVQGWFVVRAFNSDDVVKYAKSVRKVATPIVKPATHRDVSDYLRRSGIEHLPIAYASEDSD